MSINLPYFKEKKGFAAIVTIVIISAAILLAAYSSSFLGLGELLIGREAQKGEEAFALTDGCVDEAMQRLRRDANYGLGQGEISLSFSNGSCIIRITSLGGDLRQINATGTISAPDANYAKAIIAEVSLSGGIVTVTSFQEGEN